jgi:hypothetical protein
MFADRSKFLVSVSTPLSLIIVTAVESRQLKDIRPALLSQIDLLQSQGFSTRAITCDGEGAIKTMKQQLEARHIKTTILAAGTHDPVVERMIGVIKERMRTQIAALPYALPSVLMSFLVYFTAYSLNCTPNSTTACAVSPREQFIGVKPNATRDLPLPFGTYAHVPEPHLASLKSSVRVPRTREVISLHPTGNSQGSVHFFDFHTLKTVVRDVWTVLPVPEHVIELLGAMKTGVVEEVIGEPEGAIPGPDLSNSHTLGVVDPVQQPGPVSAIEPASVSAISTSLPTPDLEQINFSHTDYVFNMSVRKGLERYGDMAIAAINAELSQLRKMGFGVPIHLSEMDPSTRSQIIRSHMFLKGKYSDGVLMKVKARLVAGGNMQNRDLYSERDISSPSATLASILIIATLAAKERRAIVAVDVASAYLNADIGPNKVHIQLEPEIARRLRDIDPDTYGGFIDRKGRLTICLAKALYGCIESGKLWFDNILTFLLSLNFVQNDQDQCVLNRVGTAGLQTTICLYVDDLLITSACEKDIDYICEQLTAKYRNITRNDGPVVNYLGMRFDLSVAGVNRVSMIDYIKDCIESYNVTRSAITPATTELFKIDSHSIDLSKSKAELFHSRVAKLAYVARRTRPDILTAISFLSTRVLCPSESDWMKLERVLMYLHGTQDMGITLRIDGDPQVYFEVDASYAPHSDMKSHTGHISSFGPNCGPFDVSSTKQKLVVKSSTEGELVGVSDSVSKAIWSREFLVCQGCKVFPAKLMQDNTSTIYQMLNGKGTTAGSRHINIRYFFVKDRIGAGEIIVEHLPTEEMRADFLTKALVGERFRVLRDSMMCW